MKVKLTDLEKLVLKRALTWANSEPVLRSLTNGNIEKRPADELKLARAALNYRDAVRAIRRARTR